MGQSVWKKRRQEQRAKFRYAHDQWVFSEPSRLRFIAHYKWKKSEPKESDYV